MKILLAAFVILAVTAKLAATMAGTVVVWRLNAEQWRVMTPAERRRSAITGALVLAAVTGMVTLFIAEPFGPSTFAYVTAVWVGAGALGALIWSTVRGVSEYRAANRRIRERRDAREGAPRRPDAPPG